MKKRTILLIDKEPKNLKILAANFNEADFEVEQATSDYEALEKIKTKAFDVILSEVSGPSIDGYYLLEQIQREAVNANVPVIFLTQKSDIWNRIKSFKLGAKDYIVKPMHVKEIVARVKMILNRLERQNAEETLARKKFAGRLEDFSLADLIETFGIERKTGILTLHNENGLTGHVYFRYGSLVNAGTSGLRGEEAIYKMMSWRKGRFSMLFTEVDVEDEIIVSNMGILLEGAKRMEQREKLLKQLPSMDAVVVTTSNFKKILDKKSISPELKAFLSLFDGERTLGRIVDESPEDEITTLNRVLKLSRLGFLHVLRDFSKEPVRVEDELEPVSSRVLEKEQSTIPFTSSAPLPTGPDKGLREPKEPLAERPAGKEAPPEAERDQETLPPVQEPWSETEAPSPPAGQATAEAKATHDETPFEPIVPGEEPWTSAQDELTTSAESEAGARPWAEPEEPAASPPPPAQQATEKTVEEEALASLEADPFYDFGNLLEERVESGVTEESGPTPEPAAPAQEPQVERAELTFAERHPADRLLELESEAVSQLEMEEVEEIPLYEEGPSEENDVVSQEMEAARKEEVARERFKKAKGIILILGEENTGRKDMVQSLAGDYTATITPDIPEVSDIFFGTAEFKGGHYLNLVSFSIEKEFTPLVEYFAQKTMGFILIIKQDVPEWDYYNYLLKVLRTNLKTPAMIVIQAADEASFEVRNVRDRLELQPQEGVKICPSLDTATSKKIIFSLFKNYKSQPKEMTRQS